jgi:phycobilisome core-membrane linker protein
VINAVYVQVLGNAGYAGERNKVEEIKLENGDISLREFVRQVARSEAFRRRYWSGLYITKAIEVMHRRLLGRPTFGRWEIDAYFDTAARKGFYGVVDQMLNSREYNDCFGEDTVPYERFITPADRNARAVPCLNRPFNAAAYADLNARSRPEVSPGTSLRTSGDLTPRNLPDRRTVVRGVWSAKVAGGDVMAPPQSVPQGTGSVRRNPEPTRSWRSTPGMGAWVTPGGSGFAQARPSTPAPGGWTKRESGNLAATTALQPGAAMAKALQPSRPQGFSRRQSLGAPLKLGRTTSEQQVQEVVDAVYRQLLNRPALAAERLVDAESQFRNGQLTVAEFVGVVAGSDLFQQRLSRLAPLRTAAAAYLSLLGRAAQPQETSRFLARRTTTGLLSAINELLASAEYTQAFGQDTVPYLRGMQTRDGQPLSTVNRTASLYSGAAGLTPPPGGAV